MVKTEKELEAEKTVVGFHGRRRACLKASRHILLALPSVSYNGKARHRTVLRTLVASAPGTGTSQIPREKRPVHQVRAAGHLVHQRRLLRLKFLFRLFHGHDSCWLKTTIISPIIGDMQVGNHKKMQEGQRKARFACTWPDHAKRASSNVDNDKESMKSYGAVGAISIGEALRRRPLGDPFFRGANWNLP